MPSRTAIFSLAGMTESSTNKPEIDEDEEDDEDNWKDASPVTPICSPVRRPPRLHHRDKRSPTRYIDVDNDVEIIHEFYPTTSATMHEETSIVSYGGTIIVETTRIPRHSKDMPTRIEKVVPKVKLKKQPSVELERVPPVEEEPSTSAQEAPSKVTAEPTRSLREPTERERGKKRRGSFESEGRTSMSRETLEKSDTSSEKGAKKKVFTEDGKKRSRKSDKHAGKVDRRATEPDSSRRKADSLDDEDSKKKDHDETYRRSREERKSLKEQECIERVTEFLTRHSVPIYSADSGGLGVLEPLELPPEIVEQQLEQRVKHLAAVSKEVEYAATTIPETSIASTKRRESLKSVPEKDEAKDYPKDSEVVVKDAKKVPESRKQRRTLERVPATVLDVQQVEPTVQEPTKRPSSLRKRRDSFSRESSRESLLEEKKGVRIQEDVQEIFFEDTSEQVSGLTILKKKKLIMPLSNILLLDLRASKA